MSDSSRARFRRIEELFELAVARPEAERRELLESHRAAEPEVVEEVLRLLAAESSGDPSGIGRTIAAALGGATGAGERLGPYRLERVLGEGGMGVVFEAVQEEPIHRRVALKLIRREIHGPRLAARFHAEAQALALMSHPNVAAVLDVDTSPDGHPYVVMELIDGVPLTRYCRQRGLGLAARLELFLQVCEGVQHAHQKGVVHRDLKPSNILVTEVGGRPVPKIIDFGVARAIEPDPAAPADGLTRHGEAVGTLEYMSPEQTLGEPGRVDTRSDVYALGVILYELLTGRLPVPRERLREVTLAEAQRRVREDDPTPPSRLPPPPSLPEAAADEATSSFGRRLRGDLDWIALTALAKEPERRYPSVSALADDVRRHLRHEPVLVGPPSTGYRVAKLVRRHRLALAIAALLFVAALVAAAGTTAGMLEARRAEAAARQEAATAERVSEFLVDLFQTANPRAGTGGETPVRVFLERATEDLDSELAAEPEVRSRLLLALGKVHESLGLFEEALALIEDSLELRRGLSGPSSAAVAEALVAQGAVLRELDRPQLAEQSFRQGLALQEALFGPEAQVLAETLNGLGLVLREKAPDEAYAHYRRSLAILRSEYGPDHENVIRTQSNLAALDSRAERWEAAAAGFEQALASARRTFREGHPDLATFMGNLAFAYRKLGRHREARELLEQALVLEMAEVGADHPGPAISRINLVAVCQRLGDLEAAEEHGSRAVEVLEAALPPHHRLVGIALSNHATTFLRRSELATARALATRARDAVAGRDDPEAREAWARATVLLSTIDRRRGDSAGALALAERALAEEVPRVAVDAAWARAHALAAAGTPGAPPAAEEARALGRETADPATVALEQARLLALAGDGEAALAELRRGIAGAPADAFWLTDPELAPLRAAAGWDEVAGEIAAGLGTAR